MNHSVEQNAEFLVRQGFENGAANVMGTIHDIAQDSKDSEEGDLNSGRNSKSEGKITMIISTETVGLVAEWSYLTFFISDMTAGLVG